MWLDLQVTNRRSVSDDRKAIIRINAKAGRFLSAISSYNAIFKSITHLQMEKKKVMPGTSQLLMKGYPATFEKITAGCAKSTHCD